MVLDNPFRESRLNVSKNYRPEWDVLDLNADVATHLVTEVRRLKGRTEPDPGQMILTMTGPPGYGKTHLFGRVEHLVGHDVFFAFIPAFEPESAPMDHIRWHVVDALFRKSEGERSVLDRALARLCRPAFLSYFAELPPTLAARHDGLRRRLEESPEGVFEVVRTVSTPGPFLKLADSMVHLLSHPAQIVRALATGWAPAPWSATARRWLQGQDPPDADREALGLPDEPPAALDVLRAVPALLGPDLPVMICCDQFESILMGDNRERLNLLTTSLMDLLQAVPAQIVLSCFHDQWVKFYKESFQAFRMRVRQPIFSLHEANPDQAARLVKARLATWAGRDPSRPPLWPFNPDSLVQFQKTEGPTPRGLIQICGAAFDDWIERNSDDEIRLGGGPPPPPDLGYLFLQEWRAEIEAIQRDPMRQVYEVQEERLYRGVLEALRLAQSAHRLRPFGGVKILDVRDKAIKATTSPRPGAMVTIAGGAGENAQAVLVAVTKQESSRTLTHYLKAVYDAGETALGTVLLHPRRDVDMGAATRTAFDKAVARGRLRWMPLEDHANTYQATECLAALLDRADARELVLNGTTLTAEDCRDLVIRTGVIDNLDLFKMLSGWRGAPVSTPPPALAPSEPPTASSSTPPPPASVATPVPTPAAVAPVVTNSLDEWAKQKLEGTVRKLRILGQGVEADGFEIGPTFARLRVRPTGKTNFKGVSNKAVDLRISLGLEYVPIVGSQAGCISIDIQRPDRSTVTLAQALTDAPAALAGRPAFPVGLDVGGESHWLNLADPADCHLLVAGTTGSGKSEFLKSILAALATRLTPDQIQFALIDPKRVTFNLRGVSPYLMAPIAHDLDAALPIIERCSAEMTRRYDRMAADKLANVDELPAAMLPRIVLIIDEFAGFLEDKESKRAVTDLLKRIGSMARAAGIHLVLATQRPDKDVITPLLRDNLPGRIALRVASKAGSDLVLGSPEAENLLGRGDLFWKHGGDALRLQSPFVSQEELERILCPKG